MSHIKQRTRTKTDPSMFSPFDYNCTPLIRESSPLNPFAWTAQRKYSYCVTANTGSHRDNSFVIKRDTTPSRDQSVLNARNIIKDAISRKI